MKLSDCADFLEVSHLSFAHSAFAWTDLLACTLQESHPCQRVMAPSMAVWNSLSRLLATVLFQSSLALMYPKKKQSRFSHSEKLSSLGKSSLIRQDWGQARKSKPASVSRHRHSWDIVQVQPPAFSHVQWAPRYRELAETCFSQCLCCCEPGASPTHLLVPNSSERNFTRNTILEHVHQAGITEPMSYRECTTALLHYHLSLAKCVSYVTEMSCL